MQSPFADNQRIIAQDVPYDMVRPVLSWVYIWMFFGLAITALVAWTTVNSPALLELVTQPAIIVILLVQLGISIAMGAAIEKMSQGLMTVLFFVYTALTGFTFSILFLVYDLPTIATAFISTAGVFGVMSVIGFTTKVDLTRFGGIFLMALIGLFIAMLVNMFIGNDTFSLIINVFGVLLFTGLTAYKTQMIKNIAYYAATQRDEVFQAKASLFGAFSLYLAFINLFLFILRLLGGRRN
jgi:uncharacterized protein